MEVRVIVCDLQEKISSNDIQKVINNKIQEITSEGLTILDIKTNITTEVYIMTLICTKVPAVMPVNGSIMGSPIIAG